MAKIIFAILWACASASIAGCSSGGGSQSTEKTSQKSTPAVALNINDFERDFQLLESKEVAAQNAGCNFFSKDRYVRLDCSKAEDAKAVAETLESFANEAESFLNKYKERLVVTERGSKKLNKKTQKDLKAMIESSRKMVVQAKAILEEENNEKVVKNN